MVVFSRKLLQSILVCICILPATRTYAQEVITYPIGEFINVDSYSDTLCNDDQFICDLLNKYAPKFIFHPKEEFYPVTVDYYLRYTSLNFRYSKGDSKEIIPLYKVTGNNLGQQIDGSNASYEQTGTQIPAYRRNHKEQGYFLKVADEHKEVVYKGFSPESIQQDLIGYSNYGRLYSQSELKGYELQYWLFYPNNGGLGFHEGDWEGISVITDINGKFIYANYIGHGDKHSYFKNEIIFADENGVEQTSKLKLPDSIYSHPVVFVAKSTHASYPDKDVHHRWESVVPLPSDKTERGQEFNLVDKVQLLPNRFMATNDLRWVQFGGRWGERKSKSISSPEGPPYKGMYYKGSSFKKENKGDRERSNKKSKKKLLEAEIKSKWGKLRFEPRLPICNLDNRWLILFSHKDIRSQYDAELFRRDDPSAKYHDLSLYNFNDVVSGITECSTEDDSYIMFENLNFGGKKSIIKPTTSSTEINNHNNITNGKTISSICWEKCEDSNWVSFFELGEFKGASYFMNGELDKEIDNMEETQLGNRKINSIRYCISEGYKLVLYEGVEFEQSDSIIEILGDGSFGEIDFISSEQNIVNIKSARIISVD